MFTFALVKQNNGAIAQLVEQRTENPCVPGSIPGGTTLKKNNSQQTPDFQTKSGFFVFRRNAKNGRILQFAVFQKEEQEKRSANLHRTRFLLSDLQHFAYQESVHGFLLLSNEKTVGT